MSFSPAPSAPRFTLGLLLGFTIVASAGCSGGAPPAEGGQGGGDGAGASADDSSPPSISGLALASAGPGALAVSWTTDEPATSRIEYGTAAGGYDHEALVAQEPHTEHFVEIGGLETGVDYRLRVLCSDAAGNASATDNLAFSLVDLHAPQLDDPVVIQEGPYSLLVAWTTDEPASSAVEFGPTADLGEREEVAGVRTEHEVRLSGLTPSATYFVRAVSTDGSGNTARSASQVVALADMLPPELLDAGFEPVYPDAVRVTWRTDEPSVGRVEYGLTPALGQALESAALVTDHAFLLSGLEPGASYHVQLSATDAAGNGSSAEESFTLADKVPPVVSNVVLVTDDPAQATIRWETDEPALAWVDWGTTPAYGSVAAGAGALVQEHSVTLTGLEAGQTYHYRIRCEDEDGNGGASDSDSFDVPDFLPPVMSEVAHLVVAPGAALVTWATDEPASSLVLYGLTPSYGDVALGVPELGTEHAVILPALLLGATYHYRIVSADAAGNVALGDDYQLVVNDTLPPAVSDVHATQVSQKMADVTWKTNEPAISIVQWGPTTAYGASIGSVEFKTQHSATIFGLAPGLWNYQILAADAAGNIAATPNQTLPVADVTPPEIGPVLSDPDWNQVTLQWETDEPATSLVFYGPTAAYGELAFGPPELTTDHVVQISGLAPDQLYHFAAASVDGAGNTGVGSGDTFKTEEEPSDVDVSGAMVAWQPVTLSVSGPAAHEMDDAPNPFLDYRLAARFTGPSGQSFTVPGFFDGDGQGGDSGDVWRVRFAPDEGGTWSYELLFHEGGNVAIDLDYGKGAPLGLHGTVGELEVGGPDAGAEGFYGRGLLEYVGGHYLRFLDGSYFLKGGTNSPENLLAFKGFDNTFDQPGGSDTSGLDQGLHRYDPHTDDYVPGDPWFVSEDHGVSSKGIIGALNYLGSAHVNSVYFLPMNLGGDGRDTYPFVGPASGSFDKTHYDVSKLAQWEVVFDHATRRGILLHVVLAETESANEQWLDNGQLGVQRKLFYRELIARFAHHPAIKWNLSEENDYSKGELAAFADYILALDPYDHPIAFHTHYLDASGSYEDYEDVLGDERFSMTSLQGDPKNAGKHVETWREKSEGAGHKWVVEVDEMGPSEGVTDENAGGKRRRALWDIYFSGGHVEWYFGYHPLPLGGDVRCEDFRTREDMWDYTWYARKFLEENVPFWEMLPRDELVNGEGPDNGGAEVFAERGQAYAVYFPDTSSTGTIDLTETTGSFERRWYNPRKGEFVAVWEQVEAGRIVANGPAPNPGVNLDWVLLYRRP